MSKQDDEYPPIEETQLYQDLLRIEREQYEWAMKNRLTDMNPVKVEAPAFIRRRRS